MNLSTRLANRKLLLISLLSAALLGAALSTFPSAFPVQVAFTAGQFTDAWSSWQAAFGADPPRWLAGASARQALLAALGLDLLFIPAYAWLLAAIAHWLTTRLLVTPIRQPGLGPIGCAVAAAADVVENLGIATTVMRVAAENANAIDALVLVTSLAAAIKWAALTVVVFAIGRALLGLGWGRVLWLSRYSLLSVALGSVPLVALPQARDLVVVLADPSTRGLHRLLFFVTLLIWGLSVWYWSRVALDADASIGTGRLAIVAVHLPRWLGIFIVPFPVKAFDRSTAFEGAFAGAYRTHAGPSALSQSLVALGPDPQRGVPALVMNATIVETGSRAIVAPFTWTAAEIPGP